MLKFFDDHEEEVFEILSLIEEENPDLVLTTVQSKEPANLPSGGTPGDVPSTRLWKYNIPGYQPLYVLIHMATGYIYDAYPEIHLSY